MALLIALAGHGGAGKSTLAAELESTYNFARISGSEILEQAATTEGLRLVERSDYDAFHRTWRQQHGIDAMGSFVVGIANALPESTGVCFENLRNYWDARTIKEAGGIIVALACSAPESRRRMIRTGNPKNAALLQAYYTAGENEWDEHFCRTATRLEELEYAQDDPYGSHLVRAMNMADFELRSEGPILPKLNTALQRRGVYLDGYLNRVIANG